MRVCLKGETTIGYDASQDHAWLVEEMELWIFNNLWSRWASVARRQRATERYAFAVFVSTLLPSGLSVHRNSRKGIRRTST